MVLGLPQTPLVSVVHAERQMYERPLPSFMITLRASFIVFFLPLTPYQPVGNSYFLEFERREPTLEIFLTLLDMWYQLDSGVLPSLLDTG
jgi:hypothetical protein